MSLSRALLSLAILVSWTVASNSSVFAQCFEEQKIVPADLSRFSYLGGAISISGDVALIGKSSDDTVANSAGAAYFYRRQNGRWSLEAKVFASDGGVDEFFGSAVSVDGDRALIGASGSRGPGSAYVFRFDGESWVEEQKLNPSDSRKSSRFGLSVSLFGNNAFVGAPRHSSFSGVAYGYRYDGTTWSQEQIIRASDARPNDFFGQSISLSGDGVLIGAYGDDEGDDGGGDGSDQTGSAYVFRDDGEDWIEEQKLRANDSGDLSQFGWDVSLDGDVALVGARRDDSIAVRAGAAYIFRHDGEGWLQEQKLITNRVEADANFGYSVSLSHGKALIGAPWACQVGENSGAVYEFNVSGNAWVESGWSITAYDAVEGEVFGSSVAVDGEFVFVGSPGDDAMGESSGAVYAYDLGVHQASQADYGDAWPGTTGLPALSSTQPKVGTRVELKFENSLGAHTTGFLFSGIGQAEIHTELGGVLLVEPSWISTMVIPPQGRSISTLVPEDPSLCGFSVFLQLLQLDEGASHGVSFTAGLELTFGT